MYCIYSTWWAVVWKKLLWADEKLMVSVCSPSHPGLGNDMVELHDRDHQQGGKPCPAAQGVDSCSWISISWQLAAGALLLRMMRNSLSRLQRSMFSVEQRRLVWILCWTFTLTVGGYISSWSNLETCSWTHEQTEYIWILSRVAL